MDISNQDYLQFNSLYISSSGLNAGIGTYSTNWGFISGSVSLNNATFSLSTNAGLSASFVFDKRDLAFGASINYSPGTNSFCYISKSSTSNLNLTVATPSIDGTYIIFKRTDTNAGYVQIQPSSTQTQMILRGATVGSTSLYVRLNGTSIPTSVKLIYLNKIWYEI